jgi:hypothetical protein
MALMAHVARSIVEGFRALGLPADAIARRCDVSLEGDPSPFAVLPDSAYLALWREGLAAAPGRSTLALEVGLALPFGAAGPLDYLVGSSATVGASLRVLQGAFGLAASDVRLEIADTPGDEVAVRIVNAPPFELDERHDGHEREDPQRGAGVPEDEQRRGRGVDRRRAHEEPEEGSGAAVELLELDLVAVRAEAVGDQPGRGE